MEDRLTLATRIQNEVNNSMAYVQDQVLYGRPEWWADGDALGMGDCEDFTFAKLHRLAVAGVPLDAMWFQTCITETGEGHAVLRVRLENGRDVILDQRQGGIATPIEMQNAGYIWDRHIRADGQGGWHKSNVVTV